MAEQLRWFANFENRSADMALSTRPLDTSRRHAFESRVVENPAMIADDWKELSKKSQGLSFYQSETWCRSWLEACRAKQVGEECRIITVRDAGRLVLVWPLAVWQVGPVRILRSLGTPATQYSDVLTDPETHVDLVLAIAIETVANLNGVDALLLKGVRADSMLARHRFDKNIALRVHERDAAPYLRLPDRRPGQAREPLRSGKSLNSLKRHERRLQIHGALRYETVEGPAQVGALKAALEMKTKWLKARDTISAGYLHPANEEVLLSLAKSGGFRMFRLMVGNEVCAIEFGILRHGRYISMVQTYDERFSSHSPGRLLLFYIFQNAASDITLFDFMPPEAAHKSEWANGTVAISDYAFAITPRGRLALGYLDRIRPFLVRCFLSLPAVLRERIGKLQVVQNG